MKGVLFGSLLESRKALVLSADKFLNRTETRVQDTTTWTFQCGSTIKNGIVGFVPRFSVQGNFYNDIIIFQSRHGGSIAV